MRTSRERSATNKSTGSRNNNVMLMMGPGGAISKPNQTQH